MLWQVCTLAGHSSTVMCVAFSADGKRVVSGSADCLVKIWDVEIRTQVSSVWECVEGGGVIGGVRGFRACFALGVVPGGRARTDRESAREREREKSERERERERERARERERERESEKERVSVR